MADPVRLQTLVTIEDGTIAGMAASPAFVKEFPFLANFRAAAKPAKRGCGGCGRRSQSTTNAYAGAKSHIAALSPDRKRRLKELLRAKQIRITYRNASGKIVQLTF